MASSGNCLFPVYSEFKTPHPQYSKSKIGEIEDPDHLIGYRICMFGNDTYRCRHIIVPYYSSFRVGQGNWIPLSLHLTFCFLGICLRYRYLIYSYRHPPFSVYCINIRVLITIVYRWMGSRRKRAPTPSRISLPISTVYSKSSVSKNTARHNNFSGTQI